VTKKMAKLTAPLLSLTASGTIAKSVTYGTWKGIKYARQRVIPANPNSAGQQTQRGYLTTVVAQFHDTTDILTALDLANLNRGALYSGRPMSGFNLFCKNRVDTLVAGATVLNLHNTVEHSVTADTMVIKCDHDSSASVKMRWGVSPTALVNVVTRDESSTPGATSTFTVENLNATTKYYYQVYSSVASSVENQGIGQITTLAE